jgi:hypothetical protein
MAEMLRNPDTSVARSRYWFRILGLAIGSMIVAWSETREMDIERRLEAAIHREVVLGDLAGAMKEYRNILTASDVPRPVAARALLQTGECMEKLGRGPEAYNSYRRARASRPGSGREISFSKKDCPDGFRHFPGPCRRLPKMPALSPSCGAMAAGAASAARW